jgi:hypothetical protein
MTALDVAWSIDEFRELVEKYNEASQAKFDLEIENERLKKLLEEVVDGNGSEKTKKLEELKNQRITIAVTTCIRNNSDVQFTFSYHLGHDAIGKAMRANQSRSFELTSNLTGIQHLVSTTYSMPNMDNIRESENCPIIGDWTKRTNRSLIN